MPRGLTSRPAVYIKICGITTLGDANAVIDAGADALGLILAKSPRQLSLDRALAIAEATKGASCGRPSFDDNDDDFVLESVELLGRRRRADPRPVERGSASRRCATSGVDVIKALSIASDEFFDFDESAVDAVLIDGATPGSGQAHSWEELDGSRLQRARHRGRGTATRDSRRCTSSPSPTSGASTPRAASSPRPASRTANACSDSCMNATTAFEQRGERVSESEVVHVRSRRDAAASAASAAASYPRH